MPKAENAFELDQVAVRIDDESTVSPKASDEDRRPALLLDVSFTGSNDLLSLLDPSLKSAFYKKPSDGQEDIDKNHLPERKFGFLTSPISLEKEFTGYNIDIEYGFDEKSHIKCEGVSLDKFKIKLLEGGSVNYQLRIGMHLDAEDHGHLCQQKNEEITISLTAPEAAQTKMAA